MAYYDYYDSKPTIRVDNGIKAKSKSGAFASTWWAKKWIGVLESFNLGTRLTRGRAYARAGQVTRIDISSGHVDARVQGSATKPYRVEIGIETLTDEEWARVVRELANSASYAAKLLAGEMPQDIGDVFMAAGVPLFPRDMDEIDTECSCPDWSNPCKHIAAVYYLLGEEFDRNPFLIFELRGMTRTQLDARLLPMSGEPGVAKASTDRVPPAADQSSYWGGGLLPESFGDISVPQTPGAIVKRLGGVPYWRGAVELYDAVAPIYRAASTVAVDAFVGREMTGQEIIDS